ncbi:YbaK/EbsC family protein [Candidatus Daviesbacteria bacterium]|nr:YbaK/EbsC family protein [Candidatus Daviesbacteria bacterium]
MAKFGEIKKFLEENTVQFTVIELASIARSVEDVMKLSNGQVKSEEVIKTLIVKKGGEFQGLVLRGDDRLKNNFIDRFATKDEVLSIAGVEFGAVCPVLLGIPIIIDKKVMNLKRVNMGSGDLLKGIDLNLEDLLKVLPNSTIEVISL